MTDEIEKKDRHEEKHLDKMTVKELRDIALEIPRTTAVHDMKKEELLSLIKEHRGIKEEAPSKKAPETISQIKVRIRKIKTEKAAASEAKDRKKAALLRRRISRMKKHTRRIAEG